MKFKKMETVVFESPSQKDKALLEKFIRRQCKVFVLEPFCAYHHSEGIRFFPPPWPSFIEELVQNGQIHTLSCQMLGSESITMSAAEKAVFAIEKVYPYFRKAYAPIIRLVCNTTGDKDSEIVFKKFYCDQLGEFFSMNLLLSRIEKAIGKKSFIMFPQTDVSTYSRQMQMVHQSGCECHEHPDVEMRQRRPVYLPTAKKSIAITLKLLSQTCASFVRAGFPKFKTKEKKSYRYGITVTAPSRQFRGNQRGPDFLIDEKKIKRKEVVFLPLVPLDKEQKHKLEDLGCATEYLPLPGRFFSDWRAWLRLLAMSVAWKPIRNAKFIELAAQVFFTHFRWQSVLKRINIEHFITHCDFSNSHIPRNLLLKRQGALTWYFTDAINFGLNFRTDDQIWNRHPFWTYLLYDYFVTWNQDLATYFSMHPGSIKENFVVGCLWAEHVLRPDNRNEFVSRLFNVKPDFSSDKYLIVVFSSTYSVGGITSFKEGIAFAKHFEKLLKDIPDLLVLIKEKKDKALHLRLDPREGKNLMDIYEKIDSHLRAVVRRKDLDASLAMGGGDLIVSFPFTSTTTEALGAAQNAIWHDPLGKYRDTPFARHGNVVTHSYEELRDVVRNLMAQKTQKNEKISDNSPLFDPYRDQKAIDRFRDLLIADQSS